MTNDELLESIRELTERVELLERRLDHVFKEHMSHAFIGCADIYCHSIARGF